MRKSFYESLDLPQVIGTTKLKGEQIILFNHNMWIYCIQNYCTELPYSTNKWQPLNLFLAREILQISVQNPQITPFGSENCWQRTCCVWSPFGMRFNILNRKRRKNTWAGYKSSLYILALWTISFLWFWSTVQN